VSVSRTVSSAADRERALTVLQRHGWNATSFQILEPGFRYWFDGPDACVAYVDTGRAWVAAGPPISAEGDLAAVAQRFVAEAAARGRRACFFATEERFTGAAAFASIRIGEQPVWDPAAWPAILRRRRSLREQIRRARAKGVSIEAVDPGTLRAPDVALRLELQGLVDRWLALRPMPPMGFLVDVHAFNYIEHRKVFVARTAGGAAVAFLSMAPVYARQGWFVENIVRAPEAPNGTAEILVDAAMTSVAAAGSRYLTLGLAPLAGPVSPWLRAARRAGLGLYDFRGLHAFKAKLDPQSWASIFISYPSTQSALAVVTDALAAFARGGLLRFGIETLLRGPSVVVQLLALLLVPWTALLATAEAARWFPSAAVKWAWVAFDAVLVVGLFTLARRWRRGLDTALASLVTADAALTLLQAILWNLRRGPMTALALVVTVLAVAAPMLAALVLWRGRAHRARWRGR
jgi:phosphatidylglycerol lysyltransferase